MRPEHIVLCGADSGKPHIKATVDVSEMMGSSIHLHTSADGKDIVIVLSTVDLPAEHRAGFKYGDDVCLTWDSEVVHLFDKNGVSLVY